MKANSSIWSNEGIYQVPIEVEHQFFPTSATSMLNHQCPVNSSTSSRRTRQRETGQKRQRHVSAIAASAASDKRANNPSAVASTASEASSGFAADADLWQQQNKFHAKDFEQDHHPFQENLVGIRSNSGNYKRLASHQPPQPQAGRPNSQHIYVDMDSSTSSFSSVSGALDAPETPSSGANAQCHTPQSFVVSQC